MKIILRKSLVLSAFFLLNACNNYSEVSQAERSYVSDDVQLADEIAVEPDTPQPNIVFILVDDMGFGDVGFNDSEIATPTLDRIANAGVRLDRNYVYPICSPTRAALLTGQNPLRHGIDGPLSDDHSLPMDLKIMPEYFKDLGYQTFMIGKWHLGLGNTDHWPISRGFDYHYGFLAGWVDFYTHVYAGGLDWQRSGEVLREEGHATDLFSADAAKVIANRDKDTPFFMYLAFNAPHSPLQHVPQDSGLVKTDGADNRSVYTEMVSHMDQAVADVIGALENEGILDNTIVVFSSDNGGAPRLGASNGELSGSKGSALEGGVRVPGVIWAPGLVAGAKVFEQPIVMTDWLPTLLEAAGGDPSVVANPDGQSMWSAIADNESIAHAPFVLGSRQNRAVFDWPMKLVQLDADTPGSNENLQLFNVLEDPNEQTDLAEQQPQKLAELLAILQAIPAVESKQDTNGRGAASFYTRNEGGDWDYNEKQQETRVPWPDAAVRGSQ